MLGKSLSKRQLSSLNAQCEALATGVAELQSERQRHLVWIQREASEAASLESQLRELESTESAESVAAAPAPSLPNEGEEKEKLCLPFSSAFGPFKLL